MSQKDLLLDVNLSIALSNFSTSLGWNERITFTSWLPTILDRVYGMRNYTEFKLPKGLVRVLKK
ncbi:MAG: hypothetical protein ACKVOQ_21435 [Cyclobacteriaceae bacterium]